MLENYTQLEDDHEVETFSSNERDPDGKCQHEAGAKLDKGKNRLSLVISGFSSALQEIGKVGTYGAKKYSDNGWMSVDDGINRYSDAMYRHLLKEASGEFLDRDTDILHAAHSAWNAIARLELILRDKNNLEEGSDFQ